MKKTQALSPPFTLKKRGFVALPSARDLYKLKKSAQSLYPSSNLGGIRHNVFSRGCGCVPLGLQKSGQLVF